MVTSFMADKCICSFTEYIASESRKGSFSTPSGSLVLRPRAFTDPTHIRFSDNEVYINIQEARFNRATLLGELMQTNHIPPHPGQQEDDQVRNTTLHNSRTNKNDHSTNSLPVGEAIDQEFQARPEEPESVFDRLHAMPEDRQYLLERFLAEEDHPSILDGDENVLGSFYIESTYSPPKTRRNSLDTNLLMVGAFAADFDENPNHRSLGPDAFAEEYRQYKSYFHTPLESLDKVDPCSNSF